MLIALLAVCAVSSCKDPKPDDPPEIEYTTLAQLLELSTSSSAEFDINIKDLIVTAVFQNYAQLEDGTCGAQLNCSGHGLLAGQKYDGHVTGKSRNTSGALVLSAIDVSGATVSTVQTIPCTSLSLAEILSDKSKWAHRRVKLENITFVNGFDGSAGGSGSFSQMGVQISATCRPADLVIPDGSQGDIICYPTSASCYVLSADDFIEHEISSPLASQSAFGVYASASSSPRAQKVYRAGSDQYASSTIDDVREFRLQNFDEEWVLTFKFPKTFKNGMQLSMDISSIGLEDFPASTVTVFVEKTSGGKLWLMDYTTDTGYVVKIAEEAQ